ncbi:MAG TPA: S8 family serine peptidase [Chthoniobacterales bacterium]|jgi:hypothetical protein
MKKMTHSTFINSRFWLGFILCAVGAFLALICFVALPIASTVTAQGTGPSHKVSIHDRQLVATVAAQGGRVVADYGSFVLLNVNDPLARNLQGNRGVEVVDDYNKVLLNAGAIYTQTAAGQTLRSTPSNGSGKQMRLIQFAGPIRSEWYRALQATGARIVTYIPHNSYLVYGTAQTLQAVQQLAANPAIAQWDGAYTAAARLDPTVTSQTALAQAYLSSKGNEQFAIQLVDDADENAATLDLINRLKLEPIFSQDSMLGYMNVRVALPRDAVVNQLAQRGDVVSIQRFTTPIPQDERQDIILTGNLNGNVPMVLDYFDYLTSKGININSISTFGVNLSDTGIDNGTQRPNHFALYKSGDPTNAANSRIIYNRRIPAGGGTIMGCDGHGNLNSHVIGGYVPSGTISGVNFDAFPHADSSVFHWDRGLAPFVKIGSSVIFDPNYTFPTFKNIESQAYRDTARISSNSWGSPGDNLYDSQAQQYDALVRDAQPDIACSPPDCISVAGNQEYTIVFAAGNSGPGTHSVSSPSTAKNVITVGAAENVNPFGGSDLCGIADTGADSANDIISFSGRGPTSDSRIKPDIMGPGTHVSGGVAQETIVTPTGSGTGDNLSCYNGSLVCGGKGGIYWPLGQQWYTASSGTSHSTPATSGIAALVRQHFINLGLNVPTPALTKALIMNTARYMTGVGANDTLPSNNQGMGESDLNNFFDLFAIGHSFHNQEAADLLTATGQSKTFTGTVGTSTKPFRVTLAWTDVPGPTSGNAYVNNLDLQVTVGGNTYLGNVFSGANSITGGAADVRNNVESVFLPAGVSGAFTVKVIGTNIAGDGVPGNGSPLDQDFALVINNGSEGGGGGDITLQARGQTQGSKTRAKLKWTPTDGGDINIVRDGAVVATVPDTGNAIDNLGRMTGTFTYQVCETDSGDCSNEVDVTLP